MKTCYLCVFIFTFWNRKWVIFLQFITPALTRLEPYVMVRGDDKEEGLNNNNIATPLLNIIRFFLFL